MALSLGMPSAPALVFHKDSLLDCELLALSAYQLAVMLQDCVLCCQCVREAP